MVNIESCRLVNGFFDDPACIMVQNEAPTEILLRSALTAKKSHFNFTRPLKGSIFGSIDAATNKLESYREAGVGFTLTRVPIIIVRYSNLLIGVRCERKYSGIAYERLTQKCIEAWPDIWQEFPQTEKEWILCFPISRTPVSELKEYKPESFKSYFLGNDFPIQWDQIPYLLDEDYFTTFLKFYEKLQSQRR